MTQKKTSDMKRKERFSITKKMAKKTVDTVASFHETERLS